MNGKRFSSIFIALVLISPFLISCDPDCTPPKVPLCIANVIKVKVEASDLSGMPEGRLKKILQQYPIYIGDADCIKDKQEFNLKLDEVDGFFMTTPTDYHSLETYHDNLCRMLKNCGKNVKMILDK